MKHGELFSSTPPAGPSTQKGFGVVYTPQSIVNTMLSKLPRGFPGIAVCDPACGTGAFLVPLAERLARQIAANRKARRPTRHLHSTLRQLTGFDIDRRALAECQERLRAAVTKHNVKPPEQWQLHRIDGIDRAAWRDRAGSFDFVIGNPPYVRVQHLEEPRRRKIRAGNWRCMEGAYDLYLLFFEMGFDLLKPSGTLIYITPNSWLRSNAARRFRAILREEREVVEVYDYGAQQAFDNATTYAAISVIRNQRKRNSKNNNKRVDKKIPVFQHTGAKNGRRQWTNGSYIYPEDEMWNPMRPGDRALFAPGGTKLGDVADIHVGIQTLADSIFIFPTGTLDIEQGATRRIVKVSRMKDGRDVVRRSIIYPYQGGQLIPEREFAATYPEAYRYLRHHKAALLARDKGKIDPRKWYGYGRDVSITSGFGRKILTSSMNQKPNFMACNSPNTLFYSGYSVKPHRGVDPQRLLECLNSKRMERFMQLSSRPFQGGWFSYAKSYISNFPIPKEVLRDA